MNDIPLGRRTPSPEAYDPTLLFPISRPAPAAPMFGFDVWRSYELAWLNTKGKPCIGIIEMIYPRQSINIIESKSMKLYLIGVSNMRFESSEEVSTLIRADLERVLATPWLSVKIFDEEQMESLSWAVSPSGRCIDSADIAVEEGDIDPTLITTGDEVVKEVLYSHVLRTFCPITHQPDWGSVIVEYTGAKIEAASLLRYICSYRNHEGFGEACCERIYTDVLKRCAMEELCVSCLFTRRGGIDISPVRCSWRISPDERTIYRLIRQ